MTLYLLNKDDSKARRAGQYQLRTTLNGAGLWEVHVLRPDGLAVFPLGAEHDESQAVAAAIAELANGKTASRLEGAVPEGVDLFVFGALLDWMNNSIVSTLDARKVCEAAEGLGLTELPEKLRREFPALNTVKRGRHRDTRAHLRMRDMVNCWEHATGRKAATGEHSRFIKVAAALGYERPTVTNYLTHWHPTMPECTLIQRLTHELMQP